MAATLNVGNFPWQERWLYSDQLHDIPRPPGHYELEQKLGSAPMRGPETIKNSMEKSRELLDAPLPERPRRYLDGKFPRYTSTYGDSFRAAKSTSSASSPTAATIPVAAGSLASPTARRGDLVPRGPKRVLPNLRTPADEALTSPARPEQQSFQLWGRLNPSHCVFPYETESQKAYSLDSTIHSNDAFPVIRDHFTKVERKDFVEAQQKSKAIDVNGVHNNKNLKPFSHSKGVSI